MEQYFRDNIENFKSKKNKQSKNKKEGKKEAKKNLPPGVKVDNKIVNLVNLNKVGKKETDKNKMLSILGKDKSLDDAAIEDKLAKLDLIMQIIDEYQNTQIPIKKENIEKIADIAIINNLILPNEALTILYENKRNVGPLNSYIEFKKIITIKK